MAFDNQERINLNSKVLAAGVKDANEVGQWYETIFPNTFVSRGDKVWTNPDLATLLANPASNVGEAQANAAGPLAGIIVDYSNPVNAIRLSPVPGTNGSTYVAFDVFGNLGSTQLDNWVQPQFVPRTNGLPSIGYAVRLFDGDPNAGGTEILVTDGTSGTGVNKSVGWIFDYANGMLLLSADFRGSVADPWVLGFRYIGSTANDANDGYIDGYERIYGVAGEQNTNLNGFVNVGAFNLDGSTIENPSATIFEAVLETNNATNPAELRIYDATLGAVVTGSVIGSPSTTPEVVKTIVSLSSSEHLYLIQLRKENVGIPSDAVSCKSAALLTKPDFGGGGGASSEEIELSGTVTTTSVNQTLPIISHPIAPGIVTNIFVKLSAYDAVDGYGAVFNGQAGFINNGTPSQIGITGLTHVEKDDDVWDIDIEESGGSIVISVTGDAVNDVNWKAVAKLVEVS